MKSTLNLLPQGVNYRAWKNWDNGRIFQCQNVAEFFSERTLVSSRNDQIR